MCHLLYLETTIFTKISDYATAVFSGHSMMRPLNISPNVKNGRILNFEFRPIKNVIPGHMSFVVFRNNNIYQNKRLCNSCLFRALYDAPA